MGRGSDRFHISGFPFPVLHSPLCYGKPDPVLADSPTATDPPMGSHLARRGRTCAVLSLVGIALLPGPAIAWGSIGHLIIARLATERLSPQARAAVKRLLGGSSLATVANWADEIKEAEPYTTRWHFVDIPRRSDHYVARRDCRTTPAGDCAIAAIERFEQVLRDGHAAPTRRARALKFLVHVVGDLHQPLHCADDHDAGGTKLLVLFYGEPMDLHRVWDAGIIERTGLPEAAYAKALDDWLSTQDIAALQSGSVTDWAEESHAAAVEHAYALPRTRKLTAAYVRASRPVVDRQLAVAGVRLARVLNEALGQ
jgi:nuclease S1